MQAWAECRDAICEYKAARSAERRRRRIDCAPAGRGRGAQPPASTLTTAQDETRQRWIGAAASARTRILASYVILLALSAVVSILAIRQVLIIRLDDQVDDALQQEFLELDRLLHRRRPGDRQAVRLPAPALRRLLRAQCRRRRRGDARLRRRIDLPFDPLALPARPSTGRPAGRLGRALRGRARDENRASGRFGSDLGEAHFRAERIVFGEDQVGAFVVTILPQAEREEIGEFQIYGAAATIGLLLVASAFAWLIAGRVLAPVRQLTETARAISQSDQSDLTRRIEVRGTGDAAEMARTFNTMLDRLETVFRSQREFVQDASHELRDPLTICRGHLELMGDDPDEQRETATLVLDELERMARIVDELQVLADAERPDFLQPEWIDVEILGHELTAKASALGQRAWRLESSGEGMILADRHRLTEAVMNLAHNAVQHTHPDDTIAIGTSVSDEDVMIWVRDEGEGISVADQARIFDRFTRGADSSQRYRGGGLGLAIVRTIAEAHGGASC